MLETGLRIAILVEGDSSIGLGHLYRSFVLAEGLKDKGHNVTFFTPDNSFTKSFFLKRDIAYSLLDTDNFDYLNKSNQERLLSEFDKYDILIIDLIEDRYREFRFLREVKNLNIVTMTLFEFDQFGRYEDLTFYPFYKELPYQKIIKGDESELLVYSGCDYMFFNRQLINQYNKRIAQKQKNCVNILLTMGGSDPENFTEKVLISLTTISKEIHVDVVCGSANLNKEKIKNIIPRLPYSTEYHEDIDYLPSLMSKSSLAIINGGNTRYELSLLEVPSIMISLHDMQKNINDDFAEITGNLSIGIGTRLSDNFIGAEIEKYLDTICKAEIQGLFDSQGLNRILSLILKAK
ncbi:hypothetical protein [Aureibacter tunicatorum]|uniref:Spore coat polysaccharide biosynthesis predicted glycosyltransferase SpsG n=1 Tax=Aureibacter tunicatorum TaxID=866807 RepID=A0AAE4BRZ8_9BACT|nr:hypothetical protein [Aureibacter tunicatorum]MDR6240699.1 spore coat polysaccharide biosynthesis predicted glycosyltransferase SpsG [Aureibacter tunicatorum]BDD06968.1 spore coat polysaccharide biosynthesis protein SpsG [Aureibacter tunicatorum]